MGKFRKQLFSSLNLLIGKLCLINQSIVVLVMLFSLNVSAEIRKDYFESGALKSELNWKNGVKDGVEKIYNQSGVLIQRFNYVNGEQVGYWIR